MLLSSHTQDLLEAGCDEAGRGCLAGPVVAAAVIWPKQLQVMDLKDSKKLNKNQRNKLKEEIQEQAISWAIGMVDEKEIDRINILNASFLAMHRALDQLKSPPDLILVDGNRFKAYQNIPFECIIKGDGKMASIAAASILAKTYRDDFMSEKAKIYPVYGWEKNAGYSTKVHREAIRLHGPCDMHRKSFTLLPGQLKLFK